MKSYFQAMKPYRPAHFQPDTSIHCRPEMWS